MLPLAYGTGSLAVVLSAWLVLFGIMEITLAFRVRAIGKVGASVAHAT